MSTVHSGVTTCRSADERISFRLGILRTPGFCATGCICHELCRGSTGFFQVESQLCSGMESHSRCLSASVPSLLLKTRIRKSTALLTPYADIDLAASEMEILARIDIKEGDVVKAGQLVASMDDAVPKAALRVAEASRNVRGQLESARAGLETHEVELERLKKLCSCSSFPRAISAGRSSAEALGICADSSFCCRGSSSASVIRRFRSSRRATMAATSTVMSRALQFGLTVSGLSQMNWRSSMSYFP